MRSFPAQFQRYTSAVHRVVLSNGYWAFSLPEGS
jgi:hypothetical protein